MDWYLTDSQVDASVQLWYEHISAGPLWDCGNPAPRVSRGKRRWRMLRRSRHRG